MLSIRLVPKVQALVNTHALEPLVFLDVQTIDEKVRQRREWYGDHELAVSVVATSKEGLLLVRKSQSEAGYWSLPGEFKERGEAIEAARVREVKEETGYQAKMLRPPGVFKSGIASPNGGWTTTTSCK
jgi:8-oxo-dGTP pyrophosphatase MutT (NUDIX family)